MGLNLLFWWGFAVLIDFFLEKGFFFLKGQVIKHKEFEQHIDTVKQK